MVSSFSAFRDTEGHDIRYLFFDYKDKTDKGKRKKGRGRRFSPVTGH
jgi:hypothetical protein